MNLDGARLGSELGKVQDETVRLGGQLQVGESVLCKLVHNIELHLIEIAKRLGEFNVAS